MNKIYKKCFPSNQTLVLEMLCSCCILTRVVQMRCTGGCGNRSTPSCGWHCAGCLCLSSLLHPGSSAQPEPGDET